MRFPAVLAVLAGAFALWAAPAFDFWTASEQASIYKQLSGKVTPQHVALNQAANWGNHSILFVYRTAGDGEAEFHETQNDIFVVQKGKGILIAGGKVVNGKTTAPNEIRGPSIEGGEKRELAPGDVVHIPAKTPHQTNVAPGQTLSYLVVKVAAK
jgi:mannose-6-phosphate isomerase-like protein (cupin superfamily)